jgi:hypothetical protein
MICQGVPRVRAPSASVDHPARWIALDELRPMLIVGLMWERYRRTSEAE